MPRIARKTKRKSAIMGREAGSTQQRSMTNPTNCGITHFQSLPIPSLIIHPSEGAALKGFAASIVHMQHFASQFDVVGSKFVKCLWRYISLCSEPFASLLSPYVTEEIDEQN